MYKYLPLNLFKVVSKEVTFKCMSRVAFLRQIIHNWTVLPLKDSFNSQRTKTSIWLVLEKISKKIEFCLDGDRCFQQLDVEIKVDIFFKKINDLGELRAYLDSISSVDYISWTSLESIFYFSFFTTAILVTTVPPHAFSMLYPGLSLQHQVFHIKALPNTKQNWKIFLIS